MTVIDYRRFGTRQLEELGAQASRSETDFKRRLDAQLSRADLPFLHQTANPDPVAKRLGFLLAKVRDERCAVERELATRRRCGDRGMRGIAELLWEGSCAGDPPFIHDDSFATKQTLLPAAVA